MKVFNSTVDHHLQDHCDASISVCLDEPFKSKQQKPAQLRSTGLYAKAGTIVTVTLPEEVVNKGVKVVQQFCKTRKAEKQIH